jgi:hypothetical protein
MKPLLSVEGILIYEVQSYLTLKFGDIEGETESMFALAQENKLLQEENFEKCYYKQMSVV